MQTLVFSGPNIYPQYSALSLQKGLIIALCLCVDEATEFEVGFRYRQARSWRIDYLEKQPVVGASLV
jgi:hypothetical protein